MRNLKNRNRRANSVLRACVAESLEQRVLLTAIVSGQTIIGNIAQAGRVDSYTFSASAGTSLEITMGTGDKGGVHPDLSLFGPSAKIQEVTSSFSTGTVRINYVVPANGAGTYTIVAQDDNYDSSQTGTYNLELAKVPSTSSVDPDGDSGAISSGQTKLASINRLGNMDIYTFSATASDSLELTMGTGSTGSVHPDLTLYGPSGIQIQEATTSFNTGTARITYVVPAGGTGAYTVIAQDDNHDSPQTGAYNLELAKIPATQAVDPDGDSGVLTSGQTKFASINRLGNMDIYTFSATANDSFELTMGTGITGAVHPDLTLYGPSGSQIQEATSSFSTGTVRITYVVPTSGSGIYTVVAQDDNYDSPQTGAYNLELAILPSTPSVDPDGDSGIISSGQTKLASINRPGNMDVYAFSASASDSFELTMGTGGAGSVHPDLTLYGPSGIQIQEATSSFSAGTVRIIYVVPAGGTGTYTVIAQDDNNDSPLTGAYNLELAKIPAIQAVDPDGDSGVLTSNQTKFASINRLGNMDIYTFSASVKDSFELTMSTGSSGAVHPDLTLYDPSGAQIQEATSSFSTGTARIDYVVPTGGMGTYTVVAQDDNYDSPQVGPYNLELTGVIHNAAPTLSLTPPAAQSATTGVIKKFLLGSFVESNATGPYAVDVNWGDGSPDTEFSVPAPGGIPAQSHTYAKAGMDTASIVVTDSKGNRSNKGTFVVTVTPPATASIAGNVFKDLNGNGVKDSNEAGAAGVKVYLDINKDGSLDAGDVAVVTDAMGNYKFANLAAGTYRVREVLPSGYKLIAPVAGYFDVAVATAAAVVGKNFADASTVGTISGIVFNDGNSNGVFDPAELGVGLWQVYIDANKDGTFDAGDKLATTDADGNWSFTNLVAGTYSVRVVQRAGTATTTPTGGVLTITLAAGQTAAGKLFGEKRIG